MARKTFGAAIHEALDIALGQDPSVILYGLGTTDPKGVFGTTLDLHKRHGDARVFDMPTAEGAMTGIGIGAALGGLRPVITHQRLDFALLSLDQLVNNAAKWRFMFGGQRGVPLTVRMILGRGWGQGPTHSQSLQAWFAHVPGLKVVMPATPADAKGLLLSAIHDDDPVIFLEHRWLHALQGEVPEGDARTPIGLAQTLRHGDAATIVASSLMTIEALHAADHLAQHGVHCDVIDLRSLRPLDWDTVFASVRRTGRLCVVDSGTTTGSVAGEIVARVAMDCFASLKAPPVRLAMPDAPEATSPALTRDYHVRAEHISDAVGRMLGQAVDSAALASARKHPHDVPGDWFTGPF
jgi:pyruvate dehydrogenase E1 component beta subunit